MYNILPPRIPLLRLPKLCYYLSISHHPRFQQPLHAYVQVCCAEQKCRLQFSSFSSSLVTGSRSHKTVQSDVSRILRFYYNDPVSWIRFCLSENDLIVCYLDNTVRHLCRE